MPMLQDMQNNMGGSFRGDPSGGRSESPVYNRMLEEQQFNSMGQQPYGQQGVAAIQEKRANMGMPNAGPQGSPAQGFANGMDPELLQQIVQMMQATQGQGGMPPAPAGKTAGGGAAADATRASGINNLPSGGSAPGYDQSPTFPKPGSWEEQRDIHPGEATYPRPGRSNQPGYNPDVGSMGMGIMSGRGSQDANYGASSFNDGNWIELQQNGYTKKNGWIYRLDQDRQLQRERDPNAGIR